MIVVPILTKISGNGFDEEWKIIETELQEFETLDDFRKCTLPNGVEFYTHMKKIKKKEPAIGIEELETRMNQMNTYPGVVEDVPFWEHFLEEENFNLIVGMGKKDFKLFDEEVMRNELLSEKFIGSGPDYNFLSSIKDREFNIHEKREMTIRANLSLSLKFPDQNENNKMLKGILNTLYMGVLEYSGYAENSGNWVQYDIKRDGPLTFLEHKMLGMEIG